MKIAAIALSLGVLTLAACGGGGSTGGNPGPPPTNPPTATPSTTTAQGTLVDDPSGSALSGVKVQLDPWGSYPTPGPTPTPIATTTTDSNGHFTISAKNGTYLLVIGSDSVSDTTRPTIHDKIVLNGQTTLVAPTMPPFPGYTPPPAETSGKYRLASINQTLELPCIQEFDNARTAKSLPLPVLDEWLTENARAAQAQSQTTFGGQVFTSNPFGFLSTPNEKIQGGSTCQDLVDDIFVNPGNSYALNENSVWLAITYLPYTGQAPFSAYGVAEFPYDPRVYTDPNAVPWP